MTSAISSWDLVVGQDQVTTIASRVASELSSKNEFCIWLRGDLGAGKTTFSGALLHALGLPTNIPVLSPTFTYMTEYDIHQKKIAHMDLYRLVDGDSDSVESLLAQREFWGIIVEWPERCAEARVIKPTHVLDISYVGDLQRRYQFKVV